MQIIAWLRRLAAANRIEREFDRKTDEWIVKRNGYAFSVFGSSDATTRIKVPKPGGAKAFEVVGIPLPQAGFYVVELASPQARRALPGRAQALLRACGDARHQPRRALQARARVVARVGDAAVRRRAGRQRRGRGARLQRHACIGRVAPTPRASVARQHDASRPRRRCPRAAREESQKEFFVTARTSDDFAYAFSDWGEGISPWRFNVPTGNWQGPYLAHAVLDRSLVRAGETVSMKLFVRKQTGSGFALPPRAKLGDTLLIRHVGLGEGVHGARDAGTARARRARRASRCRRTPTPARTRSWSTTRSRRRLEGNAGAPRRKLSRRSVPRAAPARALASGRNAARRSERGRRRPPGELSRRRRRRRAAGHAAHAGRAQGRELSRLRRLQLRRRRRQGRARGAGRRAGSPRQLHVRRSRPRGERRRQRAATQRAAPTCR